MQNERFGLNGRNIIYDSYDWVLVNMQGGSQASGKVNGVEEGYLKLFPYRGFEVTSEGLNFNYIVEEGRPMLVNSGLIVDITPTSRESIENACARFNKREQEKNQAG